MLHFPLASDTSESLIVLVLDDTNNAHLPKSGLAADGSQILPYAVSFQMLFHDFDLNPSHTKYPQVGFQKPLSKLLALLIKVKHLKQPTTYRNTLNITGPLHYHLLLS